jgi:hypothetical protein
LGYQEIRMTLLDEIKAKCSTELLASGDHQAIAEVVNVGRTRLRKTELGPGGIVAAIGDVDAANAFLDIVTNRANDPASKFRHIASVINRGEFDMGEPMAQLNVQAMVPVVLTQQQADKLKALGLTPDPINELDVRRTLYASDGTFLG